MTGWLGRRRKPCFRALRIDFSARFSEPFRHTTRTSPGPLPVTADASERAFGTLPPAGGEIEVSGAGSGQYDGRSRWAEAVVVTSAAMSAAAARMRTIGANIRQRRGAWRRNQGAMTRIFLRAPR